MIHKPFTPWATSVLLVTLNMVGAACSGQTGNDVSGGGGQNGNATNANTGGSGAMSCSAPCSTTSTQGGGSGSPQSGTGGGSNAGGNTLCAAQATADIFDSQCNLDAAAYKRIAASLSTAEGIAYRYGPDASVYPASSQMPPTIWKPDDKHFDNHGNGKGWDYEVAGPQDKSKNDYSSNMAQVLYVADGVSDHGVDTLTTLLMGENTFSEKPQLPWVYYGGGHPEPNLLHEAWVKANGRPLVQPTALGRSYGSKSWGVESILAFQSGFIGTAGSNTADNDTFLKLPANKVPTAVTVTNNNEFALITVWDTDTLKGQVAVLALGTGNGFWGDWKELYPGLRNLGLWTFIKLLGYVDLPIAAPTEISASTDNSASDDDSGWLVSPDGKNGRYQAAELSLSNETNRQSFVTGPNKDRYSKAGFAVVVSKSEHKAVFLDLKPLFGKVQTIYFSSQDNFKKTQDVGKNDSQWPYAFSASPDFAPTVVKTIDLNDRPTAVRTSIAKDVNQAYIATQNGTLHVYSVGGYGANTSAKPDDIRETATIPSGKNPTCIAYAKHDPTNKDAWSNELIVVSRGERKIDWITLSASSGSVLRTLRDSRILDPIWAEDNDGHGTESYLLTVNDYNGKQVLNYRYGPVIFHTNGGTRYDMGPDGKATFEFGGSYAVSGKPFQASGANVP